MEHIEKIYFRKKKQPLLLLSMLVASLIFSFVIGEVILRIFSDPIQEIESIHNYVQFNLSYGLEPKPNLNYEEYGIQVTTNENAMFGTVVPLQKRGMRIAHLGDSYTAGPGIAYQDNYPYLVEKILAEKFPEKTVDTVIGGTSGSSPMQQQFVFEKKILPYDSDIVVYELYHNDIRDDNVFTYSSYWARLKIFSRIPPILQKLRFVQKIGLYFADQQFARYEKEYENIEITDPRMKRVWDEVTVPSLEKIHRQASENNALFVVFYIPSGHEFSNEYSTNAAVDRLFVAEAAREWTEKNNIPFVDLYDTYASHNTEKLNELYLPGDKGYHLTEKGASIAANLVSKMIIENSDK